MSDTPRTDAVHHANVGHPLRMTRMIDNARQMERELNQWKACAQKLANHIPGVSDEDCRVLDVFEKLKGETK